MKFEDFEKLIDESFNELPERFRDILIKNDISLLPRSKVPKPLRKGDAGRVVFGVFVGVPFGGPGFMEIPFEPTRIELYKESFEETCGNTEEIKHQIKLTVIHEVAHYFGFTEKQLRKLGY